MKKSTISRIQKSLIEKGYLKKQTIIDENGREKETSRTNIQ
jgi:DNA-binding MarR family transcriptional regulator